MTPSFICEYGSILALLRSLGEEPLSSPKVISNLETGSTGIESDSAWRILGISGLIFVLVGGIDALLVWMPAAFGTPEWEFGSVTAGLNGLPLPVLGLCLMQASSLQRGRRVMVMGLAGVMALLALLILLGGVLYATNIPVALTAVESAPDASQLGLKKSIAKTVVQLMCYPVGLAFVSWQSWKLSRSRG